MNSMQRCTLRRVKKKDPRMRKARRQPIGTRTCPGLLGKPSDWLPTERLCLILNPLAYSAGGNSGPRRTLTKKEKDHFFLKAQNP